MTAHPVPVITSTPLEGGGDERATSPSLTGIVASLLGFGLPALIAAAELPAIVAAPMASTTFGGSALSYLCVAIGGLIAYLGVLPPVLAGSLHGYLAYALLLVATVAAAWLGSTPVPLTFAATIGAYFTIAAAPRLTVRDPLPGPARHWLSVGGALLAVGLLLSLL